jgi:hypothetical protein
LPLRFRIIRVEAVRTAAAARRRGGSALQWW